MTPPAVVEIVMSRWVLGGAVAVILVVVAVLSWTAARGAGLADERDYPAESYALLAPGARVYHPAYGLGRVAVKPEFAGHVFVDFDDDRETGRLVPAVDLSPVDPQDEQRITDLLDRGAVLHFGPRPSPTPVTRPTSDPSADDVEAFVRDFRPCGGGVPCQLHDSIGCAYSGPCCPSCPNH